MKTLFCEFFTDNWILLVTSPGNWEVSAAALLHCYIPLWHWPPAPHQRRLRHKQSLNWRTRLGLLILQLYTSHTIRRHLPSWTKHRISKWLVNSFYIDTVDTLFLLKRPSSWSRVRGWLDGGGPRNFIGSPLGYWVIVPIHFLRRNRMDHEWQLIFWKGLFTWFSAHAHAVDLFKIDLYLFLFIELGCHFHTLMAFIIYFPRILK